MIPLLSVCRSVEFDNLPCVNVLFWLISVLQDMFLNLQVFAFERQNMTCPVNLLLSCILHCDAGPGSD